MRRVGSRGGNANVTGDNSVAQGGDAGKSAESPGGKGGDAKVVGDNSSAYGGRGGRGGIVPGMPGGNAAVDGDNVHVYGGMGGEAPQSDGRGGRGGSAFDHADLLARFGLDLRRRHMRVPYFEANAEPGRGGDGADTPQYMARRLIVEWIKKRQAPKFGIPNDEVWWDRETITIDFINHELVRAGHYWTARIVDDEYVFIDTQNGPNAGAFSSNSASK